MKSVKGKNTAPEIQVRRLLHSMGYRFRLHRRDLPGRPDIVLTKHRTVIFVHGCFWHGHGCPKGQPPKSNHDYWLPKLEGNVKRDRAKEAQLIALGWKVITIWQCETVNRDTLKARMLDLENE